MRGIVVDENVVMEAIEGRKPNGDRALPEGEFVLRLLNSGIRLFVNEAIVKKYHGIGQKIGTRSRPQGINNAMYGALMQTLADGHRLHHVDGVAADWPGLKKCDKEFVGVALHSGGMLVTGGTRLRELVGGHPAGSAIAYVTAERALAMPDVWT